jgi:hypothetical protein
MHKKYLEFLQNFCQNACLIEELGKYGKIILNCILRNGVEIVA